MHLQALFHLAGHIAGQVAGQSKPIPALCISLCISLCIKTNQQTIDGKVPFVVPHKVPFVVPHKVPFVVPYKVHSLHCILLLPFLLHDLQLPILLGGTLSLFPQIAFPFSRL